MARLRDLFKKSTRLDPKVKHTGALTPDALPAVHLPSVWMRPYGIGGSYAQIYASQYNVRTAVDLIARECASLHMHVYESIPRGEGLPNSEMHLFGHGAHELLDSPSPGMADYRFWYALFSDLLIYDVSYLWKVRVRGMPKALIRIPPQNISIERDPLTQRAIAFRATDGSLIPIKDVIAFWGYDPATNEGFIPPMETLRRLLAEEYSAGLDREGRWANSSRKDGVIERDVNSDGMSDEQIEAFYLDLEDATGGARGSGRPVLLQPGMSWQDVQWSPKELEYIEARKLSRAEVAAFFHIPPAMMAASLQGQEPSRETLNYFYTHTLPPLLNRVEHEFDAQLIPDFEILAARKHAVYTRFDLDEKLRGSFEERISILATAAGGPIITVNEARSREGLPPIPGGDLIFVPLNSIRGGGPQASPQNPVETPAIGLEPAGVTPGGGVQPQASLSDVIEGRAIVLGAEQARAAVYGEESIQDILDGISQKAAEQDEIVFLAEQRARYEERVLQIYLKTFDRQKRAEVFVDERWDRELSDDLFGTFYQAAEIIGGGMAELRHQSFDATRSAGYLRKFAEERARDSNQESKKRLEESSLEETYDPERAAGKAREIASWLCAWLTDEVTRQNELTFVGTPS